MWSSVTTPPHRRCLDVHADTNTRAPIEFPMADLFNFQQYIVLTIESSLNLQQLL